MRASSSAGAVRGDEGSEYIVCVRYTVGIRAYRQSRWFVDLRKYSPSMAGLFVKVGNYLDLRHAARILTCCCAKCALQDPCYSFYSPVQVFLYIQLSLLGLGSQCSMWPLCRTFTLL
jgi:hypothetical protein